MPADKHLYSQPIPTASTCEEVGTEDLDSHVEDDHSPPKKTADPRGTKICLDCGKDYNTKKLNKHFKEVHRGQNFTAVSAPENIRLNQTG